MEKRIVLGLLTVAAFFIAQKGGKLFLMIDGYTALPYIQKVVWVRGVWYMLFPLLLLGLFHGFSKMGTEAGVATRARQGIGIGLLGALPMLFGAAALAGFRIRLDPGSIFTGCVLAAVAEELLYRGFLFGQLFRHSRLGFFPAGLMGALIFGAGHLYQSQDPSTMAGIFLITMMGGLWFSWLYVEWGTTSGFP
ncbi:MAG: CPBP family intramembrane metalloprotease [Haliscomenobacter sp.]|nr:CPBP family intramembrane metalloprotease [Haliscomenobacter sp.]